MIFGLAGAVGAAAHLAIEAREAPVPPLGIAVEAMAMSSYVWRGVEVDRNWVSQYDASIERGGFTFDIWANLPTTGDTGQPNEVDLTLSFGHDVGRSSLSAGVISYQYPLDTSAITTELTVDFEYATGMISPFFSVAHDVDLFAGATYCEVGLNFGSDVSERVAAEFRLGSAWANDKFNTAYFGPAYSGLNGLFADAAVTYSIGKDGYMKCSVGVWDLTAPVLRASVSRSTLITFGFGVGIEF